MKTILILMDTLNRRYLKSYNKKAVGITPNFDEFSKDCIIYDNHFIGSAPCMPARRDIFTGRMHFLERGWGGIEPFDNTFPQILRNNGYYTHITTDHTHYFEIGGENYCYLFNTWDYHRGQEFDSWISRVNPPQVDPKSFGKKSSQYLLNKTRFTSEPEYPTPRTFRSACEWIKANKDADNYFLMVESFDPHEPFDAPDEYHRMYKDDYTGNEFCWPAYAPVTEPEDAVAHLEKCYLSTLTMADHWFGKFIETLRENGVYDDTLIIFTTDHGHMLGEHGFTGKNFMPAYNEMAHIPLMIHLPKAELAGKRVDALTQNIDIMPTVLRYHNCEIPDIVKGTDLIDTAICSKTLIKGNKREEVIYGWFGRAVNVYDGTYTYFRAPKDKNNQPCHQLCGIPSTIWRYFGEEYAESMEMGRFLPYTEYPVYKISLQREEDISGSIDFVMENELYDIKADYLQLHKINNKQLENEMCKKLVHGMTESDSPKEQFERLGLEKFV